MVSNSDAERISKLARCEMYQLFDVGILLLANSGTETHRIWKDEVGKIFRENIKTFNLVDETFKEKLKHDLMLLGQATFEQGQFLFFQKKLEEILASIVR